tara:strand:+ start:450 stop:635 length:186 start_codon:yes stop_codon:yes gene_type:complete
MRKKPYTNKVNRGMRKLNKNSDEIYKLVKNADEDITQKDRDDIRTALKWISAQVEWYMNRA